MGWGQVLWSMSIRLHICYNGKNKEFFIVNKKKIFKNYPSSNYFIKL